MEDSDSDYIPSEEEIRDCPDDMSEEYEYIPIIIKRKLNELTSKSVKKRKLVKRKLLLEDFPVFPDFVFDKDIDLETIEGLLKIVFLWNGYKNNNCIDFDSLINNFNVSENLEMFIFRYERYNKLSKVETELNQIKDLVGMKNFKKQLCHQILFFIQGINTDEMMHTILYGQPGTGKTTVGRILSSVYSKLGFLSRGTFRIASREDFVDKYLGHTAIKTKNLLESCVGGVLFIDEAYSLGSGNNDKDSFAKEAVDTLNRFLSENTKDFVCIIAGYKNSLKSDFFSQNPGLERRFPWSFHMDNYSDEDLYNIFKGIKDDKFSIKIEKDVVVRKLFDSKVFKNNGGDCHSIFDRCKISFGIRNFKNPCVKVDNKFVITDDDIINGVNAFMMSKMKKENKEIPMGIYC